MQGKERRLVKAFLLTATFIFISQQLHSRAVLTACHAQLLPGQDKKGVTGSSSSEGTEAASQSILKTAFNNLLPEDYM